MGGDRRRSGGNRATGKGRGLAPFVTAAATIAFIAGCSTTRVPPTQSGSGSPATLAPRSTVDLGSVSLVADVSTADDCDGLVSKLREAGDAHVGPYGFGYGYGYSDVSLMGAPNLMLEDSAAGSKRALAVSPAPGAGTDYSTTNNQEAAVDEADTVKTDGKVIVVARGDRVIVVDVSGGPAAAARVASVDLSTSAAGANEMTVYPGGYPSGGGTQLLLDGSQVMAIGQRYARSPVAVEGDVARTPGSAAAAAAEPPAGPTTVVRLIDIADPASPKVTDTFEVDGTLSAARLVNGRARLVVRSEPLGLQFVQPQSELGEKTAEEMNRRIIAAAPIDQWLPHLWRDGGRRELVPCDRVYVPATFAGLAMTSILTVPFGPATAEPLTTSLLAPGDITYTSDRSVYVTAQAWVDPRIAQRGVEAMPMASDWKTAIHRFDIDGDGAAAYVASGEVPGTIRNSFSMGQVDDLLGVATTSGAPWSMTEQSSSQLLTLRTDGIKLIEAGRVDGLGKGESIYSVRFVGARAYVVTFRQTDPFYVIDLTNPMAPKLAGELKILGYSGYLHPVAENRILGIGRDATEQGRLGGMKATLFDTSDPTRPTELATWIDPYGTSDVEWDHHAFLWWEPAKLALFPSSSGGLSFVPAPTMVGLRVGDGLSEAGRIVITQSGDAGRSECRRLSAEEISALGQDPSAWTGNVGFVQACAPGQMTGAAGYQCSDIDVAQVAEKSGAAPTGLGLEGQVVQLCSPGGYQPIERSIVIGDTVYVLAGDVLQANALSTLAPGGQVRLG